MPHLFWVTWSKKQHFCSMCVRLKMNRSGCALPEQYQSSIKLNRCPLLLHYLSNNSSINYRITIEQLSNNYRKKEDTTCSLPAFMSLASSLLLLGYDLGIPSSPRLSLRSNIPLTILQVSGDGCLLAYAICNCRSLPPALLRGTVVQDLKVQD